MGTHRGELLEDTMSRIEPSLSRFGVTRLANVTGLDRIGIPVVLSIRPVARTLSVDAGKGLSLLAARVSAAMESIERCAAERHTSPSIMRSYEELPRELVPCAFDHFPLARHSLGHSAKPERWSLAWSLTEATDRCVPTALIGLKTNHAPSEASFQMSSNGLSAGNTLVEAVVGGLYEVIERDAITSWSLVADHDPSLLPKIRWDTVDHPDARALHKSILARGLGIALYDCRSTTEVPVILAVLWDKVERHNGVFKGYGAHLDPGVAIARAITEAAQSRLVVVAGSRDDILRSTFNSLKRSDAHVAIGPWTDTPETVDAARHTDGSHETLEADLATLRSRIENGGDHEILVVDITPDDCDVSVVRVIVPGYEPYRQESYSPGPRARAFLRSMEAPWP